MPNVFISYRSPDADLAERLAAAIRDAGHDVWLDRWRIDVGDSIVARIDEGLTAARYLVLCLSADGNDTPWITREWMATLARQLEGAGVKLLPVRLSGGSLPAILADLKYADLVRDWPGELQKLLRAIR